MLLPISSNPLSTVCSILTVTMLLGCSNNSSSSSSGNSGTSPPQYPTPNDPSHPSSNVTACCEKLSSTASAISPFAGIGIRSGDETQFRITHNFGTLDHETGAIAYSDGDYTLVDPNGFSTGIAVDGFGGALSRDLDRFSSNYDYVMPVTFSYESQGVIYTTAGFAGIITDSVDVPVSGNASYSGEVVGTLLTSDKFFDLADGTSTALVNFGSGTVDVTLDGFTLENDIPINSIEIIGMTISGSTFSGGELTTFLDNVSVDVTGANTLTASEGMFFGWDDTFGTPDEISGATISSGDDAVLLFTYIGD